MNNYMLNLTSRIILGSCRSIQSRGYKSVYSIDKLYPNSKLDLSPKTSINEESKDPEKFNGVVNFDELEISCTKSSGPGGQNVNKVNTKVEIRFHVQSASWIPDPVKTIFTQKEAGRINKSGFFIVTSDKTRKQMLNRADCIDKIRTSLFSCNEHKHKPSDEQLDIVKERKERARASILVEKRNHSLKKQCRQTPNVHDF